MSISEIPEVRLWFYVSGAWADKTSDVIGEIEGFWGSPLNDPLDLLADTGYMNFILNNTSGDYSPGLGGALADWGKGTPVKLELTFEGEIYNRFRGVVSNFPIQSGSFGGENVSVEVVDWMDYAATHPMVSPGLGENETGDEMIETILADMPIQPQATDLDTGINVFPTTFDKVTTKTKAYSEFAKISFSELGPVYLRKDRVEGETLVFESAEARHGLRTLTEVPIAIAGSDFLLKEDGDFLLKEDGDKIILNELGTFTADNSMYDLDVEYGQNVINRFTNLVYPRRVDAAPVVLFELETRQIIGTGETIIFRGNYSDPDGGSAVSGRDMVTPVIGTDYDIWTNQDGTGTDIKADLVVSVAKGTEGTTFTLTNGNVNPGWVWIRIRGTGIYTYNPIEHAAKDPDSINTHGYKTKTLHQKYKQDLTRGALKGESILEQERNPRTKSNEAFFVANRSDALMMAFLNLDVGDLVYLKEAKTGVDQYFYIQGVKFSITPGGFVRFSWIIQGALSLMLGLSLIACEFDALSKDCLDFGYLPQVAEHAAGTRSYSAWVYIHSNTPGVVSIILASFSDPAGFSITATNDWEVAFYQKGTLGPGVYVTGDDTLTINTLHHILVTRDASVAANHPIIYIDGVNQAPLEELSLQNGPTASEVGVRTFIGNEKTSTLDYPFPFDGVIHDVRIFDVILIQAEATSLAAGGNVTRGMVFQGPVVRTKDLTYFTDRVLGTADKVLDNMFRMVGTPNDSPTTRIIP